jgi:hypothetical protein
MTLLGFKTGERSLRGEIPFSTGLIRRSSGQLKLGHNFGHSHEQSYGITREPLS